MTWLKKSFLAAFVASTLTAPAGAQSLSAQNADQAEAEELLRQLAETDRRDWRAAEGKLMDLWNRSGSVTVDLMFKRGETALEDGRIDDAIAYFSAVTDHAPDFAAGWEGRATAFFMNDQYGLALHDLRKTLTLNPNHFGALVGLGLIYSEMGNYAAALEAYERAKALNPHHENMEEGIGYLNHLLGRATL